MRLAEPGEFDLKAAPRIDRDAACPQCSARAQVRADGTVWCLAEGGVASIPEEDLEKDRELFALRRAFLARLQQS